MRLAVRGRAGWLLMDVLLGMALLGVLLGGLHTLRVQQARILHDARSRLIAVEAASGAALLASLDRTIAADPSALAGRVGLARALPGARLEMSRTRWRDGVDRLTARVHWTSGTRSRTEEVQRLVPQ